MSRFKRSPGVVLPPLPNYSPASPVVVEPPDPVSSGAFAPTVSSTPANAAPQSFRAEASAHSTIIETVGFALLCVYMISGQLTDLLGRYMGGKLYLSAVAVALLPIFWFASQNRFRFFQHKVGRFLIFFLLWMLIDVPFSTYRHGSFDMLREYIPRSFAIFIYIMAFTVDIRKCRILMLTSIAASFLELLATIRYGGFSDDGRYRVVETIFSSNSNELAMQLLLGIVNFAFLFYSSGVAKKLFAAFVIPVSAMYMLKTGSRGCFLAAIGYGLAVIFFSRRRALALAIAVICAVAAFATVPTMALDRLKLLLSSGDASTSSADGSRLERTELLKRSLVETAKHPIFGVGPNAFPNAVAGEKLQRGEYAPWLGTHNSYTQVSSECGLPAFFFYFGVIVLCARMNYRLLKLARQDPAYKHFESFAITLFAGVLVYAICTFFFHMAYSGSLPTLAGLTLAVHFAYLQQRRTEEQRAAA